MERTQKLSLDFTETGSREEFMSAYCGDMSSNVVELTVNPALDEGELLLCSFIKDGKAVDTLVITDNRLVIPYSVLKEKGSYTAAFAVADMTSRLTASAVLTVSVAEDRLIFAPAEDQGEDQTFASYILAATEQTARAAATEQTADILTETDGRLTAVENASTEALRLSSKNTEDMDGLTDTVDDLTQELAATRDDVSSLTGQISGISSDITRLEAAISAIQPGGTVFATGSDCIPTMSGTTCCLIPVSNWIRIGNKVIMTFGFFSSQYTEFTITALPFTCDSGGVTAILCHPEFKYSSPSLSTDMSFSADFVYDFCQTIVGTKQIKVHRLSGADAVVSGTLVYTTSDPMPEVTA